MGQLLYTITAVMLLGITALNVNTKIHGTQERLMFSELALDMTSVGSELLNEIGKYSYDPSALLAVDGATLTDPSVLRDAELFGTGTPPCDPDPAAQFVGCVVINDFHGTSTTRTRTRTHSGTTHTIAYTVTDIQIRYVEETPPHAPTHEKTFAKEALVTVATPGLVDGSGNPIEVTMSRVYMYPNYERSKPYSTF